MSSIAGTNIASPVVPFDTGDKYATHEAKYGKGGHRTVKTLAERNAIPALRREVGMTCFVEADNVTYKLAVNPTGDATDDTNWAIYVVDADKVAKAIDSMNEVSTNRMIYFALQDAKIGPDKTEFFPPTGVVKSFIASVPVGTVLTKPVTVALEHYVSGSWVEIVRTAVPVESDTAATLLTEALQVQISSSDRVRVNVIDSQENIENMTCQANIGLTNY